MQRVEHTAYADTRANGVLHAAVGAALGIAAGAGMALRRKRGSPPPSPPPPPRTWRSPGRELGAVARASAKP